jgi:hypothetical protein
VHCTPARRGLTAQETFCCGAKWKHVCSAITAVLQIAICYKLKSALKSLPLASLVPSCSKGISRSALLLAATPPCAATHFASVEGRKVFFVFVCALRAVTGRVLWRKKLSEQFNFHCCNFTFSMQLKF